MSESERGCGYRKIGGLYLVSDPGAQLHCDGLPLPLEACGCCGFKPSFSRNLQKIQASYITQAEQNLHNEHPVSKTNPYLGECSCPGNCQICFSEGLGFFGLIFVGAQSYTPETFIKEAIKMGVSKRIPELPSWLKLGETWIFLAHMKTPKQETLEEMKQNGLHMTEQTETAPAIFYGFKPQRCEMPVWKEDISAEEILKLESQGITPVLLDKTPENMKKHKYGKDHGRKMQQLLEDDEE